MCVLFPASKHEVQSGVTLPLFIVPILLSVMPSLKNSSPVEVVTAHNKHCQDQANIDLTIADPNKINTLILVMRMRALLLHCLAIRLQAVL